MTAFDIIVAGTGPAGRAAAAALARGGARIALVGPAPSPAAPPDTRTAALFTGSMALLRNLGAMPMLAGAITPLEGIRIVDDGDGLLRAPEVTFTAAEIGLADFGANVPQMPLAAALAAVVRDLPNITGICAQITGIERAPATAIVTLDDGRRLEAPLVVAADGRNSICRQAAGIAVDTWDYPQIAIAAQFSHSRGHRGISTEFHRPAGPCTVVPMPGLRSSLVWVERPAIAQRLAKLDDTAFAQALEQRLYGILGTVSDIGPRRLFPLSCLQSHVLGANRIALVGDAGHVMPPIGAQGLNLGFRDVATLADLVTEARQQGEDIGSDDLLSRYSAARYLDIKLRSTAVDLLNRSLLVELLPADLVRGLGLHAIAAIGALKRQVMRAGFEPVGELPSLMRA